MSMATIKEDSWDFGCVLGDSNDVSVSSTRAATFERALSVHCDEGAVAISKVKLLPGKTDE